MHKSSSTASQDGGEDAPNGGATEEDPTLANIGLGKASSSSSSSAADTHATLAPLTDIGLIVQPPSTPVASPFALLSPSPQVTFLDFPRVAHSFSLVHGQVAHGLERLKQVSEFVRRVCAAKQTYSGELLRTSAAYQKSTGASGSGKTPLLDTLSSYLPSQLTSPKSSVSSMNSPTASKSSGATMFGSAKAGGGGGVGEASSVLTLSEDAMGSSTEVWNSLRESLFEEARQESEFATKVQNEVVVPMQAFYAEAEKKRKLLQAHHAALSVQIRALTDSLLASKIATVKQIQQLQLAEQRERDASLGPSDVQVLQPPPPGKMQRQRSGGNNGSGAGGNGEKNKTRKALGAVSSFFSKLGSKDKSSSSTTSSSSSASNGEDLPPPHHGPNGTEPPRSSAREPTPPRWPIASPCSRRTRASRSSTRATSPRCSRSCRDWRSRG
jgi:hypothetical protein